MKIVVVAVGKVKEAGIREAIDDYATRIERYAGFAEIQLKDGSPAETEERMRRATPARAKTVALEVDGEAYSSQRLSRLIATCEGSAVSALVFYIGGAYGLPASLSRQADVRLSLSAMTLPHRLARLLLVEQVYRGFTILRNEPYSH